MTKEEKREYDIVYRKKYRETHKEDIKNYYKKNKEKRNTYNKEYYYNNFNEVKLQHKKYREKNKDKIREYFLKLNYNITIEEYNNIFEKQEGYCIGCGKHQSDLEKSLCVDHSHKTGEVRGLLCDNCNKALGFVNDNINVLENLTKYLKFYNNHE